MFRKLLFGLSFLLVSPAVLVAQQRNCGTMDHLQQLEQQYPGTKARLKQVDREIQQRQNQAANFKINAGVITIPVVVHVVYRNATQDITQAQIQSQIDVLNEDFSKTNADAANTPTVFKPLAGDMQIRFELAKRDPNGDPTTGITRTQTTKIAFSMDDAIKFANRGGHDIWDRDKYLNIWVGNLSGGLLGYAQFPGSGPDRTDGVVIGYNYFGRTGTLSGNFNKGRTATHEVGHWLGLYHIWGDEPNCANDDQVADTPLQKSENFGCPTFPRISGSGAACAVGGPGAMFMNYMDYVDDACMNMFTIGQVSRARDALQTQRPSIITSDGDSAVIVTPLDASVFKINWPQGISCDPKFVPQIILKNRGSGALTSAQITYKIDNGALQNYLWNGNLNSFETATVTLPQITVNVGNHTLTVTAVSPNGQTDNDPSNDAQTVNFEVKEKTDGLQLPFSESFEAPQFPPQGWTLTNPDAGFTWERTRTAAFYGKNSVFINNYDYEYIGEVDELLTPALDLSKVQDAELRFKVAYTPTSFGTVYGDTLEILASTDCGVTFSSLYKKTGQALATIQNPVGSPFFPSDTLQWRTDTVSLKQFGENNNVILKFRTTTGYENNLFLDDVNVNGKALQPKPEPEPDFISFGMYPNPTIGNFTLRMENESNSEATIIICNSIGQKIMEQKKTPVRGLIELSLTGKADGIYHIQVISEGKTHKQKLVLNQVKDR